ncbi:DUF1672 family protein [Camelliibacillus cellulosilyticus]|uniref:DUF1672 family protein n=1 Tax=Camelliibacillus cellulosilyticus TaxID=2174486 RepID=A0ABV9GK81_9BACL
MADLRDHVKGKENDYYVSVQDYIGQGYELPGGKKNDKIAEKHKREIDIAVKKFFLEKYKTKVKVHNIVGNKDGATVFVESIGEPHFHSFAIVPIDAHKDKILGDRVWSQEGQVEDGIKGGVFAMIFDREFGKLNSYLETVTKKYPIIGSRKEALNNVGTSSYLTPYYFISVFDDSFNKLLDDYLIHPNLSKEEWKKLFHRDDYPPKGVVISINLYMARPGVQPDKKIFNKIVSDIEAMKDIPRGSYSIRLNDNRVNKKSGIGEKDNTLERSYPNDIIKQ